MPGATVDLLLLVQLRLDNVPRVYIVDPYSLAKPRAFYDSNMSSIFVKPNRALYLNPIRLLILFFYSRFGLFECQKFLPLSVCAARRRAISYLEFENTPVDIFKWCQGSLKWSGFASPKSRYEP